MKKKIVSVLLCATMVTGLAMGCGKSSDSSSENTSGLSGKGSAGCEN